ncbi:MAG: hypothetical protein HY692_09080, partial [Cyanobacteria bacterium NC_groundwater_1444_Ag_S-0.65um_54_12]|nr:hypothetical protein [Cyanobacteria bacterium NC_groundwater_1444_Ag_S-0.65um_54_12]
GEGYLGFGYAFLDVPFRTTASGAISVPWRLPSPLKIGTFGTRARVSYTNTSWASEVQTEIILDFGILGAVPVARAFASAQDIPIPSVANSKYILVGTASSANRRHESRTLIDTNTPQRTVFDLLSPPEPLYPAPGAKGLGGHPEFGWKPVNGAGSYLVEIFEGEGPSSLKPKWRGITTGTTLRYPWFGDADLNGGAILPGASYSWAVHAIRSGYGPGDGQAIALRDIPAAPGLAPGGSWLTLKLTADDLTRSSRGQPFRPFRQKTFESITRGMEFTR